MKEREEFEKNRISVIVPVYKSEDVLKRCVDSILSQTYKNLEVILVDDGSPDASGRICDNYAEYDSRVRVIHKRNSGVAAARNSGLDIATGEYCTFVDSDDYIDSHMYQSMMKIMEQYKCDLVMCDCIKEYINKKERYTHNIRSGYYNREQIEKEYFPHLLMMPNVEYPPTISNWLCLYKRKEEIREKNFDKSNLRYEEGIRFSEDLLFGGELIYHTRSFYYMKGQCFYHYWMNPKSATHTFVSDKWKDYKKLHMIIKKRFLLCKEYDFSQQIDLVLLFFVFNAVGEIISTLQLKDVEKVCKCKEILQEKEVCQMFKRLCIGNLPISLKQKIIAIMYKYGIGLKILILKEKMK